MALFLWVPAYHAVQQQRSPMVRADGDSRHQNGMT